MNQWDLGKICTRSRDRTGMGIAHWFLRPARLPIPPSGRESLGVGVGVKVWMGAGVGVSHSVGCEDNRFGGVVQIFRIQQTAF